MKNKEFLILIVYSRSGLLLLITNSRACSNPAIVGEPKESVVRIRYPVPFWSGILDR